LSQVKAGVIAMAPLGLSLVAESEMTSLAIASTDPALDILEVADAMEGRGAFGEEGVYGFRGECLAVVVRCKKRR
jgi:hypothetical protein